MFEKELRRVSEMREEMSRLYAVVGGEGFEADAQALADFLEGLQALDNATQATQLAILAHLAAIETEFTMTVTERHHGLGHVSLDAAPTVAVHTGTTTDAAGRRVSLAAAMASRFPGILDDMAKGVLHPSTATKVVTICEELDAPACRRVEEALRSRLGAMDPSRVRSETRRAIQRVALSESAAVVRRSRAGRAVDISPGPDGMTYWWAMLPAETSNAMWASISKLAKDYKAAEPGLNLQEARADALADLVLSNVSLTTQVTLGIPVLSSDTSTLGDRLAGAGAAAAEEELMRIPESLRHSTPFGDDQHVATAQAPAWVSGTPVFVSGVEIPTWATFHPTPSPISSPTLTWRCPGRCWTRRPVSCSRRAATVTARPRLCAGSSRRGTAPAGCTAATGRRPRRTSITASPGPRATRRRRTWPAYAGGTTGPSSSHDGSSTCRPTALAPG